MINSSYTYTMKCSVCEEQLVPIVYGFPTYEQIMTAKEDKIVLGGLPRPLAPTHFCIPCQEEYRLDEDTRTPKFSHNK
jgi:hypothetical protein